MKRSALVVALCALALAACSANSSPDPTDDVSDIDATDGDDLPTDDDGDGLPTAPPAILSFAASSSSLGVGGGSVQLSWVQTGATELTIDHDVGVVTGATSTTVAIAATTTFTLTATNAVGTDTATTTVTVAVPSGPPSISAFTADHYNFPPGGGTVRLSWSQTDAEGLTIDQGIGDVWGLTYVDVPVTTTKAFTLTATNLHGSAQQLVLIQVASQPPPSITSFTATPNIRSGAGYVTLAWAAQDYDTLSIDNGVGDVTFEFGSIDYFVTSTTTFTLSAYNPLGTDTQQVTVFVE